MAQDSSLQPTLAAAIKEHWLGVLGGVAMVVMTWLPFSYLRMVGWPWVLVWQAGFLAIAIWLLGQLRHLDTPFRPLGHGLDWAVAVTGISLIVCSLASDFKTVALWNVILAAVYVLTLYSVVNWASRAQVKAVHLAVPLAVTVLGTAVISLLLWRPSAPSALDDSFSTALRNAMPFGHHNFVGGYFALATPVVLACAIAFKGWLRWGAVAASLLAGAALYVSGSRGALLGVLVWFLVVVVAFVVGATAKSRLRRLAIGGGGLALAALVLASNSRVRSLLGGLGFVHPSGAVVQDGPLLDRYFMFKTAVNILRDRPLVGVGPGVMSRVSNLYRPIETGMGLDHAQQLHSTPAQFLGEMGLLGLALYGVWLVLVVRLWLRLYHTVQDGASRWLLYGIGGSILAYSISSLTDYQLENIGISITLVALLTILLQIADHTALPAPSPLGGAARRYFSLGLLAWLIMTGYLWLMADLGFWFAQRALHQVEQENLDGAIQNLSSAAAFVPWDPTYPALVGQELYGLRPVVPPDQQEALRQDTLANFSAAAAIAPNDAWFNYNLAALLLSKDPAAAEVYSRRALQLLPRKGGFGRYLLGQAYLAQGQTPSAITALSLEGVVQPEFLTLPLWQKEPFAPLQASVLDQAVAHHGAVLGAMSPEAPGYAPFYDQTTLVRWWYRQPLPEPHPDKLSPITQALLATDRSIEAALAVVTQALDQAPQDQGLLLLRAWLQPSEFAQGYFAQAELSPPAQAQLAESFTQHREARSWLTSLVAPAQGTGRSLLGLTYRNRYAQAVNFIAPLAGLDEWVIPGLLGLFPEFPREFAALDQTVETLQIEQLNLPSAVNNHFEITPPPP
ncbi:O-antigen ligase family protein [Nodosilinea nodulosa]|uniref:O-antigen ligase family protein n=1 Tax=Nodosilinea nodulosa TaxID=416001 RepID=UPI0002E23FCE|nr:O-antigen ligase family protein [Nodosilinea nodulosa]